MAITINPKELMKTLKATLATVAAGPLTPFSVLGSTVDDDAEDTPDVSSKNPVGNEAAFGFDKAPMDPRNLMLYRFMGGNGFPQFTFDIKYKMDALKGMSTQVGYRGLDYFLLLLNGTVRGDQLPAVRAQGLDINYGRGRDAEVNLKLTLRRGDIFALYPDGPEFYRVYTPKTGQFFYFRLKDVGTFRYRQAHNEVVNLNGSKFSVLVSPIVSQPLSVMYGTGRRLRMAQKSFIKDHRVITKEIWAARRRVDIKKQRFIYRVGDVVTGFNGTKQNWLVAREIYDKNNDRSIYVMVLDNGKLDQTASLAEVEKNAILQDAPSGFNGLGQLPGIEYVRTMLHRNQQNTNTDADPRTVAEEARQTRAFKTIYDALEPKVQEIIKALGLDGDAAVEPVARDPASELPYKDPEREMGPGAFDMKPGRIVYVSSLPEQERTVYGPVDAKQLDDEKQKRIKEIDQSDPMKAEKVQEINREIDAMRRANTMPLKRTITFPNSEGWYLVVGRKDREDSSLIDWILMPYPKNRKIKARIPEVITTTTMTPPTGPWSGPRPDTKSVVTKDAEFDYFIFHLPSEGPGSLLDSVVSSTEGGNVTNVRWPKDPKALTDAEMFVKMRDVSGNAKRVEVGDLISYESKPFYVVGKKKVGTSAFTYTLAPLRAFVDVTKSSLTPPYRFVAGGVAAIGYKAITKAKDGPNSLDQTANKIATADQLDNSGLRELFLKYYSEFEADGSPRPQPLAPAQLRLMPDPANEGSTDKAAVDLGHFTTSPKQPDTDPSLSKPVTQQQQKMLSDKGSSNAVKAAISNGTLKPGTLIEYNWPGNRITTEIFYGPVGDDKIRLVPHDSDEFFGKPDGIVPARGFFNVVRDANIRKPGFWDNYYNGFYDSSSSPVKFEFAPDFEQNFKRILKQAGEPVPQDREKAVGYIGADDPKAVAEHVKTRKSMLPRDVEDFVTNFEQNFLDTSGSPKSLTQEDPIGKVVQFVRDGQVIRSVIVSGVSQQNKFEPKSMWTFKVYPDAAVGMNTSVPVMDVDKLITPQDVDPYYEDHAEQHAEMKKAFAAYIRKLRNPTLEPNLPTEFREYYREVFGIRLK